MSSGEHICIHLCGHIHVSSILESQDMCMFSFTNISLKGLLTWFSLIILPRLFYGRYLLAKYSPISGILNQFHFSYSRGWILVLFIVCYFSVAKWTWDPTAVFYVENAQIFGNLLWDQLPISYWFQRVVQKFRKSSILQKVRYTYYSLSDVFSHLIKICN